MSGALSGVLLALALVLAYRAGGARDVWVWALCVVCSVMSAGLGAFVWAWGWP